MLANLILVRNPDNSVVLGVPFVWGIVPVFNFESIEQLRTFSFGLLGYCEYFSPHIPDAFIRAFKEDK